MLKLKKCSIFIVLPLVLSLLAGCTGEPSFTDKLMGATGERKISHGQVVDLSSNISDFMNQNSQAKQLLTDLSLEKIKAEKGEETDYTIEEINDNISVYTEFEKFTEIIGNMDYSDVKLFYVSPNFANPYGPNIYIYQFKNLPEGLDQIDFDLITSKFSKKPETPVAEEPKQEDPAEVKEPEVIESEEKTPEETANESFDLSSILGDYDPRQVIFQDGKYLLFVTGKYVDKADEIKAIISNSK